MEVGGFLRAVSGTTRARQVKSENARMLLLLLVSGEGLHGYIIIERARARAG